MQMDLVAATVSAQKGNEAAAVPDVEENLTAGVKVVKAVNHAGYQICRTLNDSMICDNSSSLALLY